MASIRRQHRRDGTTGYAVLYRIHGRQSSLTFDDPKAAETFRRNVDTHGPVRALEMYGIADAVRRHDSHGPTVADWVAGHIEQLSGVEGRTVTEYRGILKNDIGPVLGSIPLTELNRGDISRWIAAMRKTGQAGKTIANKHGLLSAALTAAVVAGQLDANPAARTRLPRTERPEMRFLTGEEFARLVESTTEYWRPMIRFLVASGARLGEVTALRPGDVNRVGSTVRISRSWKRGPGGYQIGPPKTQRSVRTINIPKQVLDTLDYDGEWLFTTPGAGRRGAGSAVRPINLRRNVWYPALQRAKLADPQPRLHDLRHTCASWMIQTGVPLPVIQAHLGHESINTTVSIYGHIDRASAAAAADAIGGLLG